MLDQLAERDGVGITALFRAMLRERAAGLGIEEPPPDGPRRRRPGRPPNKRTGKARPAAVQPRLSGPSVTGGSSSGTVGEMIARFRESFGDRGEGTRRDLERTVEVLTEPREGGPLLPDELPLASLDQDAVSKLRDRIGRMDLRLARKNLYLTYLRMMLHFAVKEPDLPLESSPALDLERFTIQELGGWPGVAGDAGSGSEEQ
ncbi:MAG: hypothetical protein R6V85_09425 [Polyangia bacterium]